MTLNVALELVRKAAVLELIAPWCAVRLAQPRFGNEKSSVDILVSLFGLIFYGGICKLLSVPGQGVRGGGQLG